MADMLLQAPEMVFQPSLDQDAPNGFYNMVDSLLDDVYQFASLVPRVATHLDAQDYRVDLDEVHNTLHIQIWKNDLSPMPDLYLSYSCVCY